MILSAILVVAALFAFASGVYLLSHASTTITKQGKLGAYYVDTAIGTLLVVTGSVCLYYGLQSI